MTVDEAIRHCSASGHRGWGLAAFSQRCVAENMRYSYDNSFDMPSWAFKKGRGYCWHQAATLNKILRKLDFDSRMVYAVKVFVPEKVVEGIPIKPHYSGHVWCRVIIDGEEKDVCPGNTLNTPGILHFKPVSNVKDWNWWVSIWSYLGSIIVNAKRLSEFKRLKAEYEAENTFKSDM